MENFDEMKQQEWLETDGLGGFASGTVAGIRTRRYHALLLASTDAAKQEARTRSRTAGAAIFVAA